jgi:hypothetical protein
MHHIYGFKYPNYVLNKNKNSSYSPRYTGHAAPNKVNAVRSILFFFFLVLFSREVFVLNNGSFGNLFYTCFTFVQFYVVYFVLMCFKIRLADYIPVVFVCCCSAVRMTDN